MSAQLCSSPSWLSALFRIDWKNTVGKLGELHLFEAIFVKYATCRHHWRTQWARGPGRELCARQSSCLGAGSARGRAAVTSRLGRYCCAGGIDLCIPRGDALKPYLRKLLCMLAQLLTSTHLHTTSCSWSSLLERSGSASPDTSWTTGRGLWSATRAANSDCS